MCKRNAGSLLALAVLAALAGCSYAGGSANFRELEGNGVFVAHPPELPPGTHSLGQLEVSERTFYFGSCDDLVLDAIRALQAASIARGGNVVTNVAFRNRYTWSTNPECRSNLNWAWLIFPMLLPVPQSVEAIGSSYYDPTRTYPKIPDD